MKVISIIRVGDREDAERKAENLRRKHKAKNVEVVITKATDALGGYWVSVERKDN